MRTMTDSELIASGLQIQEARRKGGRTVFKMYGKEHFSKLGKLSANAKKIMNKGVTKPQSPKNEANDKLDND